LKPIISWIEETKDPNNQKTDHRGVVDLLLFDGDSNVQNTAKLASITYPRSTVVHDAEHVVSLFLRTYSPKCQCSNVYPSFQNSAEISFDELVTVLMPSLRRTPSCTIIAFTLDSLRLVNAIWPEN
jgi:hypothetical protein